MMPDTEFTKKFVAVSDGVGALARTTLFGNYIIHIVFSGAMHFLWGLIHCLQIVAHYSMLDINMPSNAHHIFSIIMSIAQFNIVPLEKAMADVEVEIGIQNDSYVHSDNFEDFGYESSDVILNLQIMFLFILLLIVLPFVLVLLQLICKRSKKCNKCLDWFSQRLFWSTYIRFILESYLELALASILRLKNFSFETGSEAFHSIVAVVFSTLVAVFLVGSTMCLQKNQNRQGNKEFKDKYGELTLGLKSNSKINFSLATQVYTEMHYKQLRIEKARYERKGADFSMQSSPTLSAAKQRNALHRQKFTEFQSEIQSDYRLALLYPTFFMLRRIVYSIILVFMLNMNYFQIQLVIVKTALFAAYLGYFKVFLSRLQNNLELWNESLTMVCAYCLIPFSGLV